MSPPVQNLPLAMDGRMLEAAGTGVTTYAHALRRAQAAIDPQALILTDDKAPPRPLARQARWLRALWPSARPTVRSGSGLIEAVDVFRLAQVYFDVHRRLLPLRVPGPPGLMHWSYPVPLRLIGWRNVYTVHDAIPLLHPDLSPIASRRHRRLLVRIVDAAAAIVTVSQAARSDIVAALGCAPSFVVDCSQPVPLAPAHLSSPPMGLVADDYLLVCGSIEPRKNIAAIVAAYRQSGSALPLVVAGPDGWRSGEIAPLLAATPGVIRLPYVDPAAMPALIGHARALLMPSLAEGFGLPVAEAMALGTPVITSHAGALAETAGGAALLVDPADPAAIAAAILRLDDRALRQTLAAAGRRNAQRFDDAGFARRLAALYAGLVAPPR